MPGRTTDSWERAKGSTYFWSAYEDGRVDQEDRHQSLEWSLWSAAATIQVQIGGACSEVAVG